jgi:hypothetical protein
MLMQLRFKHSLKGKVFVGLIFLLAVLTAGAILKASARA